MERCLLYLRRVYSLQGKASSLRGGCIVCKESAKINASLVWPLVEDFCKELKREIGYDNFPWYICQHNSRLAEIALLLGLLPRHIMILGREPNCYS